ncbi:MAG: DinB family protein [Bryobacteraceae bacterium]
MTNRTIVRILLIVCSCRAGAAQTGTLSPAEREAATTHLEKTGRAVRDAVAVLSGEQWDFQQAPGRWSIRQCVEHLILAEEFLFGFAQQALENPATPADPAKAAAVDRQLLSLIPDRSRKATAPSQATPSGRWADREEALAEFQSRRKRTVDYVNGTAEALRQHRVRTPVGEIDAYQVILMLSAHTERHLAQMAEVKAAPGYPK